MAKGITGTSDKPSSKRLNFSVYHHLYSLFSSFVCFLNMTKIYIKESLVLPLTFTAEHSIKLHNRLRTHRP